MDSATRLKLTVALAGLVCFGAGIRLANPTFRWTGLILVAIAWLLRFRKPPTPRE